MKDTHRDIRLHRDKVAEMKHTQRDTLACKQERRHAHGRCFARWSLLLHSLQEHPAKLGRPRFNGRRLCRGGSRAATSRRYTQHACTNIQSTARTDARRLLPWTRLDPYPAKPCTHAQSQSVGECWGSVAIIRPSVAECWGRVLGSSVAFGRPIRGGVLL